MMVGLHGHLQIPSLAAKPLILSSSSTGRYRTRGFHIKSRNGRSSWTNVRQRREPAHRIDNSMASNRAQSARQEKPKGILRAGSDDIAAVEDMERRPIPLGSFFRDELREATVAMKERLRAEGVTESKEVPLQDGGIGDYREQSGDVAVELSSEATSNGDSRWQVLYKSGSGKLAIESNGPPMAVLRPYLAPDIDIEDAEKCDGKKLRLLPLITPHKMRPLGLPRASLRRKFGLVSPRDSSLKGTDQREMRDFNLTLSGLAADIRALPDEVHVSSVLEKWIWRLRRGSLARTVRELGVGMRLPGRALEVLSWVQNYRHLWPDHTTLSTSIQVMVKCGKVDAAFELQRTLGKDSAQVAQTLASALAKAGMAVEAVKALNYMKASNWKIDGRVHTMLVSLACQKREKGTLENLLTETDLLQMELSVRDYTTIIASCSEMGLINRVESIYEHFQLSGLQPDVVMQTALISALSRAGKHQKALALFAEFVESGSTPDLVAYEVALDASAKLGDLTMSLKIFQDLRGAGFQPAPRIYDLVIQMLPQKPRYSTMANDLMGEMLSKGFRPSDQTLKCFSVHAADAASYA